MSSENPVTRGVGNPPLLEADSNKLTMLVEGFFRLPLSCLHAHSVT